MLQLKCIKWRPASRCWRFDSLPLAFSANDADGIIYEPKVLELKIDGAESIWPRCGNCTYITSEHSVHICIQRKWANQTYFRTRIVMKPGRVHKSLGKVH